MNIKILYIPDKNLSFIFKSSVELLFIFINLYRNNLVL